MNILNKLFICMLFIGIQNCAFATKTVQDTQLLYAYNTLIKQPAKKAVNRKITTVKKSNQRTPQINATLVTKKQINKKYRWGGTNPHTGFDCSGLIQYAYKASGIHLPRTTAAQYRFTKRVSINNLKVGDLIFFHTRRTRARVNHVGIYLGGGKFIHAPRRGKLVSIAELKGYWKRKVVGAGRV